MIKMVKTLSTQNNTITDDDKKYGRNRLGRRYGTIPLLYWSQHKKINKKSLKK